MFGCLSWHSILRCRRDGLNSFAFGRVVSLHSCLIREARLCLGMRPSFLNCSFPCWIVDVDDDVCSLFSLFADHLPESIVGLAAAAALGGAHCWLLLWRQKSVPLN
jgi:hypothetical protein